MLYTYSVVMFWGLVTT